jgi:hypothetical protein
MWLSLVAMIVQITCQRIIQFQKDKMMRNIMARMFYKTLHGKLEIFLDVIPAHEIIKTMREGSRVIIGITG